MWNKRIQDEEKLASDSPHSKTGEAAVEMVGNGETLEIIFKEIGKDGHCQIVKTGESKGL